MWTNEENEKIANILSKEYNFNHYMDSGIRDFLAEIISYFLLLKQKDADLCIKGFLYTLDNDGYSNIVTRHNWMDDSVRENHHICRAINCISWGLTYDNIQEITGEYDDEVQNFFSRLYSDIKLGKYHFKPQLIEMDGEYEEDL